ncbi:TPA: hypothetical protein HL443_23385 [Escherichia coli]|nr:hypothetical protein [Escherichia coli]HAG7433259.1 hypothetical protein [Escherichia coli]HAG8027522.1 hypothetical protein [Escherichia coli]HAJ0427527.1 hypothetical protein [Escherichia coli]
MRFLRSQQNIGVACISPVSFYSLIHSGVHSYILTAIHYFCILFSVLDKFRTIMNDSTCGCLRYGNAVAVFYIPASASCC